MKKFDDDWIVFCVIFIGSMMGLALILSSVYPIINPPPVQRVPSVLVLRTPDLVKNRQIILMPTQVPGKLNPEINWICYLYNPEYYNQTVNFKWWLAYQMIEEATCVSFYCSVGSNITVAAYERIECHLSFRVKNGTPKPISDKLKEAVIWLDVEVTA